MAGDFVQKHMATASNDEPCRMDYIRELEQTCEQLRKNFELHAIGAGKLESSCATLEETMMRLQAPVFASQSDKHESQTKHEDVHRKVEDQTAQIKKLQEKLVSSHRKTVSMTEQIHTLEETRAAMETERRRVDHLQQGREKALGDIVEYKKRLQELEDEKTSLKQDLDTRGKEIARLSSLLEERDVEIADLQRQLQAMDEQREAEAQREIEKREINEVRSSQESAAREQFLEMSLNRSMQDAFVGQSIQVCADISVHRFLALCIHTHMSLLTLLCMAEGPRAAVSSIGAGAASSLRPQSGARAAVRK